MAIDAAMADRAAMAALLLLGVVLPLMLVGLVLRVMRRNRHLIAPDPTDAADPLPCPTCGAPMPAGAVLLGRGANWAPHGAARPGPLATVFGTLPNTLSLALPPALNRAWHCEGCRILVVDHSALVASGRHPGRLPAIVVHGFLTIAGFSGTVALTQLARPSLLSPLALAGIAMAAFLAAIPATRLLFHRLLARA
ncbi:MAG TPA: hypothetical protein DDY29_09135 [Rhodobacteraceae bacterium]|jgi:hypothetical protein|nr:hypothetical protein [Paracoccaceae bacterium]HBG98866.1 hypothetical protein [Paracoccaceae bacterium]